MKWILALFAFAGIMAVMSTVASVVVEAIHKAFALRGAGLQEMLRALHDGVVRPLDPDYPDVVEGASGGYSKAASKFAKQMTVSPSYGGKGRWWWVSNLPLLGIFRRRFQNLSKLQFVEQLSQTDYGKRLAKLNMVQVKQNLNRLVYEFDRYGAGQTDYFRSRAKVFTTIVALLIVSLGNVNALSIYMHLATNDDALKGVINNFAPTEAGQDQLTASLELMIDQKLNALQSSPGSEISSLNLANSISTDLRLLSNSGFPVGREYFPYCLNPTAPTCEKAKPWIAPVWIPFLRDSEGQPYYSEAIPRILTPEGALWLLGMIATAGLIGLGATFWFNLFRTLASFAIQFSPAGRALSHMPQSNVPTNLSESEVRRPKEPQGSLAAPGNEPNLDLLTQAFLTVSGRDIAMETASKDVPMNMSSSPENGDLNEIDVAGMPRRPGPSSPR